jgi:hypothetical protein
MSKQEFPFTKFPYSIIRACEIAENYTESPKEFVATAMLAGIATICSPWHHFRGLDLNVYALLIGPSSSKKSTALSFVRKVLHFLITKLKERGPTMEGTISCAGKDRIVRPYRTLTNFSVEALQGVLVQRNSTICLINELATVLDVSKRQSQSNTMSELTSLYDSGFIESETISRGHFAAKDFSLNILAASTPY